jgi:hypothetical protein
MGGMLIFCRKTLSKIDKLIKMPIASIKKDNEIINSINTLNKYYTNNSS